MYILKRIEQCVELAKKYTYPFVLPRTFWLFLNFNDISFSICLGKADERMRYCMQEAVNCPVFLEYRVYVREKSDSE